ncbi:MAG: hypothetical protein NSGCLCUN01_04015 [uncultured Clostridium sp.]
MILTLEELRREMEMSIKYNGINHPRTTELRKRLERAINKEQRTRYEAYKAQNDL